MSNSVAGLKVDFNRRSNREPFVLMDGEESGAMPIRVYPIVVNAWSRKPGVYDHLLDSVLVMKWPGVRRIRLYCSNEAAKDVRLLVQGGSYRLLGRRSELRTETLTWVQSSMERLRFFYDHPDVEIVDATRFFDKDGLETSLPDYLPSKGGFQHTTQVTGALVVAYRPSYSLFEIEYDTGEGQTTDSGYRQMRLAWLAGNIRDSTIPPVHVIALNGSRGDQLSFQRSFWPDRSAVRHWFEEDVEEPEMIPDGSGFRFDPKGEIDPCWYRCKEKIKPNSGFLTYEERLAIRRCVETSKHPSYHYVETGRTVKTERIFSQNDPNVYVDVDHPVSMVMRFQRSDDSPCEDQSPPGCCPELVFRFRSDM